MEEQKTETLTERRNEFLHLEDPANSAELSIDGDDVELSTVLSDIQDYIFACYNMGDNPISHLKKSFPTFAWLYIAIGDKKPLLQLLKTVGSSDYIWLKTSDWKEGVVVARELSRKKERRSICCNKYGVWDEALETDGAKFV